jgi:hypothetical protein
MVQLINEIIELRGTNSFEFTNKTSNHICHLNEQTIEVPNTSGLYLVFRKQISDDSESTFSHLIYLIEGENYELIYFGKAGGLTKEGKAIKQGLRGRINNVITDSIRGLKDIKRANYWNIIMKEFNIDQLRILYSEVSNPQDFENIIYKFLDNHNLKYPILNKKRGR